jgi:hypothetical protein
VTLAFEPMRDAAMVMGDLVLLQAEVNPVDGDRA